MLVVPALALFSHLIPADFRAAARRSLATAAGRWTRTTAETGTVPPQPPTQLSKQPQDAGPEWIGGLTVARAGLMPAATNGPAVSQGLIPINGLGGGSGNGSGNGSGTGSLATATPPVTPPMVAQLADRTRQARDQQARDQQAIETQLKALGSVSFECQPLPGPDGLYSSACRLPVDAAGQLQRVFQATGHDPTTASSALLDQVLAWRQRIVQQSSAAFSGEENAAGLPATRFR